MSGPQLAALVATVVAVAALVGVAILIVQVRRLRTDMVGALQVNRDLQVDRHLQAADPEPPAVPRREPVTEPATEPVTEPVTVQAQVVEVVAVPDPEQQVVAGAVTGSQTVAAVLARPLVRASALSYGVRRALRAENRDRVSALVRRDLRRRHKIRRRAARRSGRVVPIRALDLDGEGTGRQESVS